MQRVDIQTSEAPRLGELFGELARGTAVLVREEARLAKTEMGEKAKALVGEMTFIGLGAGVAFGGVMVLLGALVMVLGLRLPLWAAALIVGGMATGGGVAMAAIGIRGLRRIDPVPRQTLETLEEGGRWFKKEAIR
jgi:hypothetical protein